MCKETIKEKTYYLYNSDYYGFYYTTEPEEKEKWIINTTNKHYIDTIVGQLNYLNMYGRKVSSEDIISVIIDFSLAEDKDCKIVFNKENQI